MNDHVLKLIEKAHSENATYLGLCPCGLEAIPEVILLCAPHLKEISFSTFLADYQLKNNCTKINWSNNSTSLSMLVGLPNLRTLDLLTCEIGDKGAESIGTLSQLTNLNVFLNSIGDIGAESISALSQLTYLEIGWNQIGDKGAISISALSQLTTLYISCNKIGNEGAESISSLSKLTNLGINENEIGDKGAESISSLSKLTYLNIESNEIGDKGAESLSSITQLINLNVRTNNIRHIDCFRNLKNLRTLTVKNNPIRDVPESIFNQESCIDDLRIWWQETADKEKVKPNITVKLQVIGNGNAGKSSIIEALKNGVCKTKFDSTHGIVIEPLNYRIENEDVNFNVWDFGGQEIYHGTHKLFIASQSIHLLVADDETEQLALERTKVADREKPDEMVLHQPLQHYIDSSKRQSPESIRIIVKNKIDVGDSISNNTLKTIADKNKIDFHSVSAIKGTGIIELRKILAQKREDILHYGLLMPVSWLNVQNFFLSNLKRKEMYRQKMINLDIFNDICTNCKVSDISRPALLDFLHHTGILYKNEKFLKDAIIADQRWALDAIYKPLDRKSAFYDELRNDFKGMVRVKDLFKAFGDGYETEHKWLFLNFMHSCSLCFPLYQKDAIKTEDSYYIFPEFLAENETPAVKKLWKDAREVKVFTYQPDYLDYYKIQKFIVDLGNKTKVENIWKNGILVKTVKGIIRVEVSDNNTKIKISIENSVVDDYLLPIINIFKESDFNNEKANWLTEDGKILNLKSLATRGLRKESFYDKSNLGFQPSYTGKGDQDSECGWDKKIDLRDVVSSRPKNLVLSYASENLKDLESIVESLSEYELNRAIRIDYDDRVVDGRDLWDDKIKEIFMNADGYLMLVSMPYQNFRKHPYIWDKEIPIIESRNAEEKVFAFCISVSPVKYNSRLEKFAAFKGNKECLPESGHERDKFLVEFAEKVIESKFLEKK